MTPEIAEYYRAMLLAGIRDKFDAAFERALIEEEPLSDLVLSLCTCISDSEQVLQILREYTLNFNIDEHCVYDLVLEDLRDRYLAGRMSGADVVRTLYRIASLRVTLLVDPWWNVEDTNYVLELYEDNFINESVFNQCFDAWFFHGERLDAWALQQEANNH